MFTVDAGGKPIEPSLARFALQAMCAQKLQPTLAEIHPLTMAEWEAQGIFIKWAEHDTRTVRDTIGGVELRQRLDVDPRRIYFLDADGIAVAELTNIGA